MMESYKKINELHTQVQNLFLLVNSQPRIADYRSRHPLKRQLTGYAYGKARK